MKCFYLLILLPLAANAESEKPEDFFKRFIALLASGDQTIETLFEDDAQIYYTSHGGVNRIETVLTELSRFHYFLSYDRARPSPATFEGVVIEWLGLAHVRIEATRLQYDYLPRTIELEISRKQLEWRIDRYSFDLIPKGWRFRKERGPEESLLINLIERGESYQAKAFLNNSYSIDVTVEHNLPLRWAIRRGGDLDLIRELVNRGADVNALYGRVLTNAASTGDIELVQYLIEEGADARRFYFGRGVRLSAAIAHPAILALLIEHGSEVNQMTMVDLHLSARLKEGIWRVSGYS
jgi:hypothetical protein